MSAPTDSHQVSHQPNALSTDGGIMRDVVSQEGAAEDPDGEDASEDEEIEDASEDVRVSFQLFRITPGIVNVEYRAVLVLVE